MTDHGFPQIITASDLIGKDFQPTDFIVRGILPKGLTIAAGPPKSGKSLLFLMLAVTVAAGRNLLGIFKTYPCGVLYISLEDDQKRLQRRLVSMTAENPVGNSLFVADSWTHPDQDGVEMLADWFETNPGPWMVVIDVFAKFKGASIKRSYGAEYRMATRIKEIADRYDSGIVLVHHTIKRIPDDWLAGLYGSSGLTGAADTIMLLDRDRKSQMATLFVTGRDIVDTAIKMELNRTTGLWEVKETDNEDLRCEA